MRIANLISVFTFAMLMAIGVSTSNAQNGSGISIAVQLKNIADSTNEGDLYYIKAKLDKLKSRTDMSFKDIALLQEAYLKLTNDFEAEGHYKSGCATYSTYLDLEDKRHLGYMQHIRDSIGNPPAPVEQEATEEVVAPPQTEPLDANEDSEPTASDMSANFNGTYLTVSAFAVLLLTFLIALRKNKEIKNTEYKSRSQKEEVRRMFRISASVSMLSGVIRYAREFSLHCSSVIKQLSDSVKANSEDTPDVHEALADLEKANTLYLEIASEPAVSGVDTQKES